MDIFGIGGTELIVILIIMLVVAGPKRMIQWAYVLGKYTSKLRAMWAETMTYVEKEMKQAGVDVELPKDVPTRGNLNQAIKQQAQKAISPVAKPLQDTLSETADELKDVQRQAAGVAATSTPKSASQPTTTASTNGKSDADLGTWSSGDPIG
jgi:Sec-independent protein translocase protein TatA